MSDTRPPSSLPETPDTGREALADALRVSFKLLSVAIAILGVLYLLSGIFTVQEHQRAYVLIMGRISGVGDDRVKGPGLHWTLPKPFSEIVTVPSERIQSFEQNTLWYFEQRRLTPMDDPPVAGPSLSPEQDGYIVTGDANLLHVRWGVGYTIRDPERYLFHVHGAEHILHKELDRATMLVAQQWPVDRLLRSDIEGFRAAVDYQFRHRLGKLNVGMQLHRLDLLAVTPPRQVERAFEAVIEAEQDRSRNISAARAYASRVRNEAGGEAARMVSEAQAERQRIVSVAEADAGLFESILSAYQEYPNVIAQTLWQDRIRRVLTQVDSKTILHQKETGTQELRLQIGTERK